MKYHGYDFVCKEARIEFDPEIIALNEIQSGHMLVATQQDGQWILEPLKEHNEGVRTLLTSESN